MHLASRSARRSAAALALASVATGCLFGGKKPKAPPKPIPESTVPVAANMVRDVNFLASDQLEGRRTGSPGYDSAAVYVQHRFDGYKFPSVSLQPFVARSVIDEHAGRPGQLPTNNIIAILPGVDPKLRGQYVILGAHLDHLGRIPEGSLDPDLPNAIRNGADDNASGVAAVMELARLLRLKPTKRSIAFIAFSGEEQGLLGSQYFVDHAPFPLDSVMAMLNFDMVGRLREDRLLILGAETAREFKTIIDSANVGVPPLKVTASGDGFGASDQTSFYLKDIPVLHFFTNVHDDYHRVSDDPEKVSGPGMERVVGIAERVTRSLADRPNRITFVRATTAGPAGPSARGDAYLGSIPDMGATGVQGLRVNGVRAGSPADKAGLLADDIIVDLGGTAVTDLQSYTSALYAHKPGDTVSIIVMRRGKRMELKATLTRRGG